MNKILGATILAVVIGVGAALFIFWIRQTTEKMKQEGWKQSKEHKILNRQLKGGEKI